MNTRPTDHMPIQGPRLYLRPLLEADVSDRYLAWLRDPEVNGYLEARFAAHSLERIVSFVATMADDPKTTLFGMFLRGDDRHIGNIKLGPIDDHHDRADIGLLIGERDCWGAGYATEAIILLTDYAFAQLGLHRLTAGAYSGNEGSARAFEKAGWRRDGLLRQHWLADDGWRDGIQLGILASDRRPSFSAP